MLLSDLKLLEVNVYDGENLVYQGMVEDAPQELRDKRILIQGNEQKKIITKLEKDD